MCRVLWLLQALRRVDPESFRQLFSRSDVLVSAPVNLSQWNASVHDMIQAMWTTGCGSGARVVLSPFGADPPHMIIHPGLRTGDITCTAQAAEPWVSAAASAWSEDARQMLLQVAASLLVLHITQGRGLTVPT